MKLSDNLLCLFTAQVEEQDGSYILNLPEQEVTTGAIRPGETYRVGVLATASDAEGERETKHDKDQTQGPPGPPVAKGDQREVEIEDIGEQGDGIARVERGYVIIVPETETGERVTVEITKVRENVAFAEVINRQTHI